MKSKIKLTFNRGRDSDLATLTHRVLESIKSNQLFPNPTPALADVQKALDEYQLALSNAGGRDRAMVSVKNDKQTVLRELLGQLAYYVSQTCKGDKTALLTAGFDLTKDRDSPPKLLPNLTVNLGIPGEATIKVRTGGSIRAYVHQYTADPVTPGSVWTGETTALRQHTFRGLPSFARLWFRTIVIDKSGQSTYLDPVSRIIQ